jgi:hypothetical protein
MLLTNRGWVAGVKDEAAPDQATLLASPNGAPQGTELLTWTAVESAVPFLITGGVDGPDDSILLVGAVTATMPELFIDCDEGCGAVGVWLRGGSGGLETHAMRVVSGPSSDCAAAAYPSAIAYDPARAGSVVVGGVFYCGEIELAEGKGVLSGLIPSAFIAKLPL